MICERFTCEGVLFLYDGISISCVRVFFLCFECVWNK